MKVPGITKTWWRVQVKSQLEELLGYVQLIEKGFASRLKRAEKRPFQVPKRFKNEAAVDRYYRDRSNELHALSKEFPSLVRRTAFLHLYSILEKRLLLICEGVHRDQPHLQPLSADKNKGIVKAKKYLKNEAKVDFPDQTNDWIEIQRMQELRNRFAHSIGKPMPATLDEYIKKNKSFFKVGMMDSFSLTPAYLPHVIELVGRFHEAVLNAIPDETFKDDLRIGKS